MFGCDGDTRSIAEAQAIMGDGGSALETARQVVDRFGNDGLVASRRQPLVRFAEVDWLPRHHDLQAGPGNDHRIARNAEAIDVMRTVLTSPSRRIVTPRASIETEPTWPGAGGDSTLTVANGPSLCGVGGTTSSLRAELLRQNDSRRCGTGRPDAATARP